VNNKTTFIEALGQTNKEHFVFTCKGADLILCLGTLPSRDDQTLTHAIEESIAMGSKLVYLFSMEDPLLTPKSAFFSRYEIGSEEGVLALLARNFLLHVNLPSTLKVYFDELDEGYVSAESNLGEEEVEEIEALYEHAKRVVLILGNDLMSHPRAHHIAQLAGILATYGNVKLYVMGANQATMPTGAPIETLESVGTLSSFDGVVVYQCPLLKEGEETYLIGSPQFQVAARVSHNDKINVTMNQEVYPRTFVCDERLKGTIALMPWMSATTVYPYHVAKIMKAEQ